MEDLGREGNGVDMLIRVDGGKWGGVDTKRRGRGVGVGLEKMTDRS